MELEVDSSNWTVDFKTHTISITMYYSFKNPVFFKQLSKIGIKDYQYQ
jgi:hypothetical protein